MFAPGAKSWGPAVPGGRAAGEISPRWTEGGGKRCLRPLRGGKPMEMFHLLPARAAEPCCSHSGGGDVHLCLPSSCCWSPGLQKAQRGSCEEAQVLVKDVEDESGDASLIPRPAANLLQRACASDFPGKGPAAACCWSWRGSRTLLRLVHHQSLSLSAAGPKENKPCSWQSLGRVVFSLGKLSELGAAAANEHIKEHQRARTAHGVPFNSLHCYSRARGLFNLI